MIASSSPEKNGARKLTQNGKTVEMEMVNGPGTSHHHS